MNIEGQLHFALKMLLQKQIEHQMEGEYQEAEECKIKYEKQKENQHNRAIAEMNARHKRELENLQKTKDEELDSFYKLWNEKLEQLENQGKKSIEELEKKQYIELQSTRENRDRSLSTKVKESSELLNLRKMEQHMAKQKNYPEAHKIQTMISQMYKKQNQAWENTRKSKIQTAINTLKSKQNTQMTNLQKRINATRTEHMLEMKKEEEQINLKYQVFLKEIKAGQQKQLMNFKGEFKSLGGTASSSPVKSRSSFNNSFIGSSR